MCPACFTTAVTIFGGTVSLSGLAIFVVKALAPAPDPADRHRTTPLQGDGNVGTQNRDAG